LRGDFGCEDFKLEADFDFVIAVPPRGDFESGAASSGIDVLGVVVADTVVVGDGFFSLIFNCLDSPFPPPPPFSFSPSSESVVGSSLFSPFAVVGSSLFSAFAVVASSLFSVFAVVASSLFSVFAVFASFFSALE